jgi:hypothetical protein
VGGQLVFEERVLEYDEVHEKDLAKRKDWKGSGDEHTDWDDFVVMIVREYIGIAKQDRAVVGVVAVSVRGVCVRVPY